VALPGDDGAVVAEEERAGEKARFAPPPVWSATG
jgi:hypothetical protein